MELLKTLNPENANEIEISAFEERTAARAVIVDYENKIALLYVGKENYYKLPGGGVDKGEDIKSALIRECKEETGCDIEMICEIGYVIENIKTLNIHQKSYGYLVKVVGEKSLPNFTENEILKEFSLLWLPYDEAIQILKATISRFEQGMSYIIPREIAIMEAAAIHLSKI